MVGLSNISYRLAIPSLRIQEQIDDTLMSCVMLIMEKRYFCTVFPSQ
jgi:hypothetical protein